MDTKDAKSGRLLKQTLLFQGETGKHVYQVSLWFEGCYVSCLRVVLSMLRPERTCIITYCEGLMEYECLMT